MEKYTFWFKGASILQIITGGIHSISLFMKPVPANETEKQLIELMTTYKNEMGAGFSPSTQDLFLALSSCFTLLYIFGGLINLYLLVKKADPGLIKGILSINVIFFGICFVIMAWLTFLPPIICTGLVYFFLVISLVKIRKEITQ